MVWFRDNLQGVRHALTQTEQYLRAGFRRLKIKVGDGVDAGAERVRTVFDVYQTLGKGNIPRLLI